jgi:hypothetical protein
MVKRRQTQTKRRRRRIRREGVGNRVTKEETKEQKI